MWFKHDIIWKYGEHTTTIIPKIGNLIGQMDHMTSPGECDACHHNNGDEDISI